jgi:hypothetical protein
MRETSTCICGGIEHAIVDTVKHTILDRTIHVHRVPHFRCEQCGDVSYPVGEGIVDNLMACLKYAYEHEMDEIDYDDWCNGKYGEE